MRLEEWIDVWAGLLDDIEPTTIAKYRYLVEFHILPEFQGHGLGSLTFEEIEAWDRAIPGSAREDARMPVRWPPGARSLLITILGDAVHAGKLERNPAERRKGRRGRVRARGRAPASHVGQAAANVLTPIKALCLAERCALLSGRDIDFVMNVFATPSAARRPGSRPSGLAPASGCTVSARTRTSSIPAPSSGSSRSSPPRPNAGWRSWSQTYATPNS